LCFEVAQLAESGYFSYSIEQSADDRAQLDKQGKIELNVFYFGLFLFCHSFFRRQDSQKLISKMFPANICRSFYVLLNSALLHIGESLQCKYES